LGPAMAQTVTPLATKNEDRGGEKKKNARKESGPMELNARNRPDVTEVVKGTEDREKIGVRME